QHKIYRVAAVGNPVMLHLLLGLGVSDLGRAPYVGTFSQTVETQACQLGLRVNPLAQLFTLPQLGGFVGADTTACLMTLANAAEATYLMIDIGTNGEIVLNNRGRMWAASAAAGPAFEGGAISCGMRAGQGAIDKVTVVDGELKLRVIGGGSPRGICGSGLIDLVACLLQYQDLDRNGNISESPHLNIPVGKGKRGREIILQPAGQTITGLALVLDQEDIRQLQLARSAVRTAVEILMVQAGVEAGQVEKVYLAGAFGNYLDPASILQIGLIPSIEAVKIRNIGNAAAEGAIMALLSQKQCELADNIRTRVQYVELADQPDFQNRFIKNIDF
ncbi:MAG: ATP-binding protein, partial [Syntrophomonadaceae bacterium]|nr:ATP-binding protein [Syntrophomonadaceae bacterium]